MDKVTKKISNDQNSTFKFCFNEFSVSLCTYIYILYIYNIYYGV